MPDHGTQIVRGATVAFLSSRAATAWRRNAAHGGDALVCGACGMTVRRDGAYRFHGSSAEAQNADWLDVAKAAAIVSIARR